MAEQGSQTTEISSQLLRWDGSRLLAAEENHLPDAVARFVHSQLRSLVLTPEFPCSAAHSLLHRESYWFGLYDDMCTAVTNARLACDLARVVREARTGTTSLWTFVASFAGPAAGDEQDFERALWGQLQALHDRDGAPWDPRVSSDPQDPLFSFSFAGTAFFVVGMHAGSSRWARRFAWPTLVFNEHDQFVRLRDAGNFARLQDTIRLRDVHLQGSVNPMCMEYGAELSEARQYAGREVDEDWRCPLDVHHA